MTSIVEITASERNVLTPLFAANRYDVVVMNSVLEGYFGVSHADSRSAPTVARLDSGAFTVLGKSPDAPAARALLRHAPIYYVTPENDGWRRLLQDEFRGRIAPLRFTAFSPHALDENHLEELVQRLPAGFELRRIDGQLAERVPSEMSNEYFFENFVSTEDFLRRGIGYCIVHEGRIVSAATSTAMCDGAIDVEIETTPDFQGRGLGTVVGAKLVSHCLQHGIEPHWLAANPESGRLAQRLGYVKGESYETLAIG